MATFSTLDTSRMQECRLLLVGKTGAGKSATGNSLLGLEMFPTSLGLKSKTIQTQCGENVISGRRLVVVDTPGFFDTTRGNDYITQELIKIFGFLSPGFHALIYVMSPDRFTKECIQTKKLFFKIFGPGVASFTIILVTGLDRIEAEGETFDKFLSNCNVEFMKFKKLCNNRILPFNNKAKGQDKETQIKKLFDMIDSMQAVAGHKCFTNLQFQTMRLYRRIGRTRGKVNITRARKHLFKKIADRYGVEQKYAWGPETDKTRVKKAAALVDHVDVDSDPESVGELEDIEYDIEDAAGCDDEDNKEDRHQMMANPSYFDRLIEFFAKLFRPFFNSLHTTEDKG